MQQKLARSGGPSKLSLIGAKRINSDKRVIQSSDVYVCMPHNENPDGTSLTNGASPTDSTTPMFEKFMLPNTPPPPPPRSNLPSRTSSLNLPPKSPPVKPKPPPIPPRPLEADYVIPNEFTSSPVDVQRPPLPPKSVKPNSPASPSVRPQKPPMPLPRTKPQAKPAVMPRIVRRLSQRYRRQSKLPSESYETFLTDDDQS